MGLDTVEIVMAVETEFNIAIADRDAERLVSVGDLYRYVLRRLDLLRDPEAGRSDFPEVWHQVTRIVSQQSGVPQERLHEDTQFVRDLRLD
ncbi:hypothetical protein DYH09_22320 [bacterium CPR1]|nr:hypothetical protein [bacterium CPR1]